MPVYFNISLRGLKAVVWYAVLFIILNPCQASPRSFISAYKIILTSFLLAYTHQKSCVYPKGIQFYVLFLFLLQLQKSYRWISVNDTVNQHNTIPFFSLSPKSSNGILLVYMFFFLSMQQPFLKPEPLIIICF